MIRSQPIATGEKPVAEVLVEGELSPFEDEALYRILRKNFRVEHPTYTELLDADLATRVNVTLQFPYGNAIFAEILRESWRDLKELFKQVSHRRGRAGAAFTLTFVSTNSRLVFKSGAIEEKELASALDQIGHLTAIVGQMLRPENMDKPLEKMETLFDSKSDRWQSFQGFSSGKKYIFDDSTFRWIPLVE